MTTGQVSGLLRLGYDTIYHYLREFPEYFSSTARQGIRGRRWKADDIEMLQAIRCLKQERTGAPRIRELLSSGWRLENEQAWTKELMSRLVESILDLINDLKKSVSNTKALEQTLEGYSRDNKTFKELWILVMDLQEEWKVTQKAIGARTAVVKALKFKKKYHGKLPELYPPRDDGLHEGNS